MAIDLGAMASAASGYVQGQQTATQNDLNNQFNQLAVGEQKLKYQQDQIAAKNQQALSDDAMRAFSATGGITPGGLTMPGSPANPVPPANLPGTDASVNPVANMDSAQKMDFLADKAAARGDLVNANELWTNATNARGSQIMQQERQSAMQTAELKRQQTHYALAASAASMVDATPEGFMQWKMQMLADPNSTPQERQNLSQMQYAPGILQKIQESGMSAAQRAQENFRQMQERDRLQKEAADEERKDRDDARKEAVSQAQIEHLKNLGKAGAVAKAPSKVDMLATKSATKLAFGDNAPDEDSDDFKQAQISIASRANQIVAGNKAINYSQAVNMAAQEAKTTGEFGTKVVPGGFLSSDKKVGTFAPKGDTRDAALPLPKNKSDLIPGKWYKGANGQVEQWTGK